LNSTKSRRMQRMYDLVLNQDILHEIDAAVFGADHLAQIRQLSFTCREEVGILRRWLAEQNANILLDLACGAGGPGRLIADRLAECIVGVDIACNALRRATDDLRSVTLTGGYVVADAGLLPLRDRSVDAILSVDFPPIESFLHEIVRILRPEGRLLVSGWESRDPGFKHFPALFDPLLATVGLMVTHRYESPHWLARERAWVTEVIRRKEELRTCATPETAQLILDEARMELPMRARVLFCAQLNTSGSGLAGQPAGHSCRKAPAVRADQAHEHAPIKQLAEVFEDEDAEVVVSAVHQT
jgi:ubiquinone/menaquinone biosynthesis C-methylase UbiE